MQFSIIRRIFSGGGDGACGLYERLFRSRSEKLGFFLILRFIFDYFFFFLIDVFDLVWFYGTSTIVGY